MTFIMSDEMWSSVEIYEPQSQIDRFKSECLVPILEGNDEADDPCCQEDKIVVIEAESVYV